MNRSCVFCTIPFTHLQINPKGDAYLCCPAWTVFGSIGRLTEKTSIEELWNNHASQTVRQHILDERTEAVCDMNYCPIAVTGKPTPLTTKDPAYSPAFREIQQNHVVMKTFPRILNLAHSGRCNLRCIQCVSNENFVTEDPKLNDIIFRREIPKLLPKLSEIILSGDGDPFFMKDTRELMQHFDPKKYPNIRFSLITNAMLLTPHMWDSVKHNTFNWIHVSIDGATKETYEAIRKGGNWEILQRNLEYISKLRKQKRFTKFIISFVVMKKNYREMKQFVQLGKRLGCDAVEFQRVFGLADPEQNINATRDWRVIREIGKILKDPIFSDRIVNISTVEDYRKSADMPDLVHKDLEHAAFRLICLSVGKWRNEKRQIKRSLLRTFPTLLHS